MNTVSGPYIVLMAVGLIVTVAVIVTNVGVLILVRVDVRDTVLVTVLVFVKVDVAVREAVTVRVRVAVKLAFRVGELVTVGVLV